MDLYFLLSLLMKAHVTTSCFIVTGAIAWNMVEYHHRYHVSTLCAMTALQAFPLLSMMQILGLITPPASEVSMYFTEGYESVAFLVFLKLVMSHISGSSVVRLSLNVQGMTFRVPGLLYQIFLPAVKIDRKFLFLCEVLLGLYAVFWTAVAAIEVLVTFGGNDSYPAGSGFSGYFAEPYHILLVMLLVFTVYNLSSVYQGEEHGGLREIIWKLLLYKIFTLVVKLENMLYLAYTDGFASELFSANRKYSLDLRVRTIYGVIVILQFVVTVALMKVFYRLRDIGRDRKEVAEPSLLSGCGFSANDDHDLKNV